MRIRQSLLAVVATLSITTPHANADHTLVAENGVPDDRFGWSVAADNGLAVVGAHSANRNGFERTGSAYIFDIATGTQLFELTSDDLTANGNFGTSVAISGERAVVGAPFDDTIAVRGGAAYVFDLATGEQLYKFIPDDIGEDSWFGHTVAVSGDYALISSQKLVPDPACPGGAACSLNRTYVYDLVTGDLAHTIDVSSSRPSLSLDSSAAVISGATESDVVDAVSVIDVSTGSLLRSIPIGLPLQGNYGYSVRVSGDSAIVADLYTGLLTVSPVYVYDITTGARGHALRPPGGGDFRSLYESAMAFDGHVAAVRGRALRNDSELLEAVFLYDTRTGLHAQTVLLENDKESPHFRGKAIAIDGPAVLIANAAEGDPGSGTRGPGAVSVIELHPADLNFDGLVGASDLATLLASWGAAGSTDLDANGFTDDADLAILFAAWNE